MNVPMTLVDNGSAINVCPLRTARMLGIRDEDLSPSTQGIRAYDNSRRQALGTITMNVTAGAIEHATTFQVVDIKASFNLLLGRPWLHDLKVVPSSLHQQVKAIVGGVPITIDASSMRIKTVENPLINVEHDENDEDLWGFSEEVSLIEEDERTPLHYDLHSNMTTNAILRKQGHFPRMTLGKKKGVQHKWDHLTFLN